MIDIIKLAIGALGYIIAFISPLFGFIYGLILFFAKRDDYFYNKHAKYTMLFAIILFVAFLIVGIYIK